MGKERNEGVSADLYIQLQQALYREARLFDTEQYEDWLAMLTEDVHYVMPMGARRFRDDKAAARAPMETLIFNDNMDILKMRIARLKSGFVWAEDPRNAARHIVSNVEVETGAKPEEVVVRSVIEVHRSRLDGEGKRITGGRVDIWRNVGGDWKLARRDIRLDHPVIGDSNLNLFF